jgi:hypothetical protein
MSCAVSEGAQRVGHLRNRAHTIHITRLPASLTLETLVELVSHACGGGVCVGCLFVEGKFALLELGSAALARYAVALLDGLPVAGGALQVSLSAAPCEGGGFDICVRPIAEGIDALALSHLFCIGLEKGGPALPPARLALLGGVQCAFVTLPTLGEALRAVDTASGRCALGGALLSVELARKHEALGTKENVALAWEALGACPLPLRLRRRPQPPPLPPLPSAEAAGQGAQLLASAGEELEVDAAFAKCLLLEALQAGARRIEAGVVAAAAAAWRAQQEALEEEAPRGALEGAAAAAAPSPPL